MAETLTACVIARDEEERLPACLASLAFCDEVVVVVDDASCDRTREVALAAGARVVDSPWRGFAGQRNLALEHASGSWALEVDADERVSRELGLEIRSFLDRVPAGVRMAAIPLRDLYFGAPLGRSSRFPRYRHRLFDRAAFRHDESRTVHEGLWPDGPTAVFEGELVHELASTWREALSDAVAYAKLEAAQRARPGAREALVGMLVRPAAKLAYRLLVLGGWRDGWRGSTRISLECAADSLAVARRIVRGRSDGGAPGHGQEQPRLGAVKLVGVALSGAADRRLAAWLGEAAAAGADVALISAADGPAGVRRRRPDGHGVGALIRALDAENQARPIDALVAPGRRERALRRIVPRELRGAAPAVEPDGPASVAVHSVQRQTRSPAGT